MGQFSVEKLVLPGQLSVEINTDCMKTRPSPRGRGFLSHFEFVPAQDDKTRQVVHRIRHEVYCQELGYEPQRRDKIESDQYDHQSLHLLLRTADGGETPVGCSRLILVNPSAPEAPLPFETLSQRTQQSAWINAQASERSKIAEISRLAIRSEFRGGSDSNLETGARNFPLISLGLMLGTVAMADLYGIKKLYFLTDPRMTEHLERIGVTLQKIGEPLEHRGTRIPAMFDVHETERAFKPLLRFMWNGIREQLQDRLDCPTGAIEENACLKIAHPADEHANEECAADDCL